jgi:hypothetical protein
VAANVSFSRLTSMDPSRFLYENPPGLRTAGQKNGNPDEDQHQP